MAPSDRRVLSYGDVLLRESDLATLDPHQWLNDNILEFYFEFLGRTLRNGPSAAAPSQAGRDSQQGAESRGGEEAQCRQGGGEEETGVGNGAGSGQEQRESTSGGSVLLMGPSVAFWVQSCGSTEAAAEAVKPLGLRNKAMVLLPVNDNSDVELAHGGSHWSLLVLHRDSGCFYHLDSAGGSNASSARCLADCVRQLAGCPEAAVKEVKVPNQSNAYDCGVFVLCYARAICDLLLNATSCPPWDVVQRAICETVSGQVVKATRNEVRDLIISLA